MLTSRFPFQAHGLRWTTHRSRAGSGEAADKWALCSSSLCREQTGGGPRQAQPRARREIEIKFTLGLLTSVQCAENVGTKFTQDMQNFRKVCWRCDQKQKKFTQQVKTLRNSLHKTGQSWWKKITQVWNLQKKKKLSKNDRKGYTEQTGMNLCKLSPKFTQACPPMW